MTIGRHKVERWQINLICQVAYINHLLQKVWQTLKKKGGSNVEVGSDAWLQPWQHLLLCIHWEYSAPASTSRWQRSGRETLGAALPELGLRLQCGSEKISSKNHVLKYYLSPLSSPASPSWWETCCWWGACCAWPCSHHHPPPWHLGKYFSLKTRVTSTKQMNMLCTETLHHSSALHKRSEQAMFSFHRWWGNLRWGEATWFEATWEK